MVFVLMLIHNSFMPVSMHGDCILHMQLSDSIKPYIGDIEMHLLILLVKIISNLVV